jgi:tetratricopeptide (TPR) repeat protein
VHNSASELTMKLHIVSIVLLIFSSTGSSAESRSAFLAGRRDYAAGEFKKAACHFKRALKANSNDADSNFWLGKSYEMLSDVRGPLLGARASFKARFYLAKALDLAPDNEEYRRELFEFLIVSDHSPGALRRAERIIQMAPESDPDYPFMLLRLHQEHQARSSPEDQLRCAISSMPQQLVRLRE